MTSNETMSVEHFKHLIKSETESLKQPCSYWRNIIKDSDTSKSIPDDYIGDINVAIGQAELLIKERFKQFSRLIDDCELKRGEKETTTQDLQGFWDIVYIQVETINKKFASICELHKNDWKEIIEQPLKQIRSQPLKRKLGSKNISVVKPIKGNSGMSSLRAHILAARHQMISKMPSVDKENIDHLTEDIKKVQLENTKSQSPIAKRICVPVLGINVTAVKGENLSPEMSHFDAGFFKIVTPVKITSIKKQRRESPSISMRKESKLLSSSELKKRIVLSPPSHKDYSSCIRITRSMKKTFDSQNKQVQFLSLN